MDANRGKQGLGSMAARGALVTLSGQLCKVGLQLGGMVVMARLLSPNDYGLLAMVMVVIAIGEVLRECGLSSAYIQAPTVTNQQRTNLFWLNTGLGLALTVAVIALSPAIAAFYGHAELQLMATWLSLTFLFNGMSSQMRAQLNRSMRFTQMAVADVTGMAAGLAVGIAMALADFGYLALVGQQQAQVLATLVIVSSYAGWTPGLPRRGAGTKPFLRYGANLMGTHLIGNLARNVDSLLIGRLFGSELLGLYNRAYQLVMLPLTQINMTTSRIALPVLSRLNDQPERYEAFLLHGQASILHLTCAGLALAAAQAGPIVSIMLGPQWLETVPLLQALAVGGAFQAAANSSAWVFTSKGLTASLMRFALCSRPALVLCVVSGAWWGVQGVAVAYSVGMGLLWISGLLWLRGSGAPLRALFGNGLMIMAVYGGCAPLSALAGSLLGESDLARLAYGALAMGAGVLLACLLWPAYRRSVWAVLESRKLLRARKAVSTGGLAKT